MCCPSPPQTASSQESALVAMQSEKNSTHKSFQYIRMRHVRYINIDPCDYTNIFMQPNATLSYPSMLLSILLVDDETDNGGKVVACHHNATLVSSIIILYFLYFIQNTGLSS